MEFERELLTYESTGYFTPMTIDYVKKDAKLAPFYNYPVSYDGLEQAIYARKNFPVDRHFLVTELRKQYGDIELTSGQEQRLQLLLQENTFTICTAHQPVIFTGPLYFIYKIFHAIKLADELAQSITEYHFVPIFYMGSEDADLDELGHINIGGQRLVWETEQTGAVGRMLVDQPLLNLIDLLAGQLEVEPFGEELLQLFRESYKRGKTIQQSTLHLVNELFKEYGLLVIIPDNAVLKTSFDTIVKKELTEQFSYSLTAETIKQLSLHYKPQASGRDLNLFYLHGNHRERLEKEGEWWVVKASGLKFNETEILAEVENYPDRFSANVILRPLFQETILPNIVFIGGGGELAYWLELKKLFNAATVYYPMLILRNSFLFANEQQYAQSRHLGFTLNDFFQEKDALLNELVKRDSLKQLNLSNEKNELRLLYKGIQNISGSIHHTLEQHARALEHKAIEKLDALEKKMLRAEKRTFEAQQRQIAKLKQQLFPQNSMQERHQNFSILYSKYGKNWMRAVYDLSAGLEQQFSIVRLKK